jgi:RNA polymerase sigma-70 factor, ECF subfamily
MNDEASCDVGGEGRVVVDGREASVSSTRPLRASEQICPHNRSERNAGGTPVDGLRDRYQGISPASQHPPCMFDNVSGYVRSCRSFLLSPMMELDDEALMRQTCEGDTAAYRMLVQRHIHRMLRLAQGMVGERSDAEDIVQEAFLRVWVHAKSWDATRAKFTTWLYRIVFNLCVDQTRKPVGASLDLVIDRVDPQIDALERIQRQESAGQVVRALSQLPDTQRAAVALHYYEGLSNAEAAEVLSVSIGAVEQLLVRARRRLKELLRPPAAGDTGKDEDYDA